MPWFEGHPPPPELAAQILGPQDQAYGFEKALKRQRALLLRQLGKRFGAVPEAIAERVTRASADDLDRWGDRLLDAASLDELFAD